jgi:hypothetical protein
MRRLAAALEELEAVATDDRRSRRPLDLSDPESLAVGNYFLDTRFGGLERDIAALTEVERHQKGGKDAG